MNCTVKDIFDRAECGEPAVRALSAICEHEHIEHVIACRPHSIGPFVCEPCMDAPRGLAHKCYMRIIRDDHAGPTPATPLPAPQDLPRQHH